MKKNLYLLILVAALLVYINQHPELLNEPEWGQVTTGQTVEEAYRHQRSDVQLQGSGKVKRVLSDDNKGSRHQRFILELPSGLSLLVAHNIDLAPRIEGLRRGDEVGFYGEYEWNNQGGVMHWTHHDPAGRHVGGWLKHAGRTYE